MRSFLILSALLAGLMACSPAVSDDDSQVASAQFPDAHRPISPNVSSRYSTEEARDRVQEADRVMDEAGINPGMTVADIGAGDGYYTIRLADRVGPKGRVLAEEIIPQTRDRLAERVNREQLDSVSVKLGEPADPKLPVNSFDRVFMVHMYHEIERPYEFLWRLMPSLRVGGRVVVVDNDRPTSEHGTPPEMLDCEMKAVGYHPVSRKDLGKESGYIALYAPGPRIAPEEIQVCRAPQKAR